MNSHINPLLYPIITRFPTHFSSEGDKSAKVRVTFSYIKNIKNIFGGFYLPKMYPSNLFSRKSKIDPLETLALVMYNVHCTMI